MSFPQLVEHRQMLVDLRRTLWSPLERDFVKSVELLIAQTDCQLRARVAEADGQLAVIDRPSGAVV